MYFNEEEGRSDQYKMDKMGPVFQGTFFHARREGGSHCRMSKKSVVSADMGSGEGLRAK